MRLKNYVITPLVGHNNKMGKSYNGSKVITEEIF